MRANVAANLSAADAGAGRHATLRQLRAKMERVEGRRFDTPPLPTHPALAALLPGGGLRPGAAYTVAPSSSLLLTLFARPTRAGSWCAAVGMPELGVEAAERIGVDLSRLVLVPEPGARWLEVAATLADVLPVVAVRPAGRVTEAAAARVGGRLREKGAALIVQGVWPGAEASLSLGEATWEGLGQGRGHLETRELTISVESRRSPVPRRARVLLPDRDGALAGLREPAVAPDARPLIRAVG